MSPSPCLLGTLHCHGLNGVVVKLKLNFYGLSQLILLLPFGGIKPYFRGPLNIHHSESKPTSFRVRWSSIWQTLAAEWTSGRLKPWCLRVPIDGWQTSPNIACFSCPTIPSGRLITKTGTSTLGAQLGRCSCPAQFSGAQDIDHEYSGKLAIQLSAPISFAGSW